MFCHVDIIFFIFLYQRWIYRVDPSRLNEFGVSQVMLESRQQQNGQAIEAAPPADASEAELPESEAAATVKTSKDKKNE